MNSVELAAHLCDIPLVDYGEHRGQGVLVGSGSGLMMAVMDHRSDLRWCQDYDAHPRARWGDFLEAVTGSGRIVVVVGWFSITNPTELRKAVRRASLLGKVHTYAGDGVKLGGIELTLYEILRS